MQAVFRSDEFFSFLCCESLQLASFRIKTTSYSRISIIRRNVEIYANYDPKLPYKDNVHYLMQYPSL